MTFNDFGFDERILRGIQEAGFETPMPVQQESFKLLLQDKRDIYAQSQTGTGKTAAFLLGIYQILLSDENFKGQKALVIVPTRELAVQIENEAAMLGKYLDFKSGSVYGGVGYNKQERMLEEGVDILIATPGRLIDFSKSRKVNLKDFGFLVIDEADRLFDMGFLPDLRKILKGMKPYNERRTMLFSATLNPRVGNLAWEYMNDPGEVIIEPEKVTVDTVSQELYHVGKDEKMQLLLGVLKRDNPENAVIFTNTRHSAWEVAKRLEVNGYTVEFLMGDLPQSKRLKIVEDVKKGKINFMVATDVAARGLHINELEMVINYDVPLEAESYVHRIGRTARAGREGKTVTLACEEYVYGLALIEKLLGRKIPVSWAEDSLRAEDKSAGMRFPPRDRYRDLGIDRPERGERRDSGRHRSGGQAGGGQDKRGERNTNGSRQPRSGKKNLDPRAARIQSVVSSVAGGDDSSWEERNKTSDNRNQSRPAEKPKSKKGGQRSPTQNSQKDGKTRDQRPNRGQQAKNDQQNDGQRINSRSSLDDRLAYYRKKYGEDFQLSDEARKSSGKQAPKPKKKKKKRPANREGQNQKLPPRKTVAEKPQEHSSQESKKTGFFGRLFGKK